MGKKDYKRSKRDPREQPMTLASAEHILRNNGAKRVSRKAAEELRTEMTNFGNKRAQESVKVANMSKRKTVKPKDLIATK